jgi:hypothetical protein
VNPASHPRQGCYWSIGASAIDRDMDVPPPARTFMQHHSPWRLIWVMRPPSAEISPVASSPPSSLLPQAEAAALSCTLYLVSRIPHLPQLMAFVVLLHQYLHQILH